MGFRRGMCNYQIRAFAAAVYTNYSKQQIKTVQSTSWHYTKPASDDGCLFTHSTEDSIPLQVPNVKLMLLILSSGPTSANFRAPPQDAWLRVHPCVCDAFPCTPGTPDAPVGESERRSGIVSPSRMAYVLPPTLDLLSAELSDEA